MTLEFMLIYGFFLRRKPSVYMMELYYNYVLFCERKRGDCMREKRKLLWMCYRLYPFSLLDNIKGRVSCFYVDVAQIG